MSLVAILAIYQIRILKTNSKKIGVGVISLLFSIGAGASCSPIGVSIMTTFGVAGVSTLSFLYNYEILIDMAIAILSVTCIMMIKRISRECKLSLNKLDGSRIDS